MEAPPHVFRQYNDWLLTSRVAGNVSLSYLCAKRERLHRKYGALNPVRLKARLDAALDSIQDWLSALPPPAFAGTGRAGPNWHSCTWGIPWGGGLMEVLGVPLMPAPAAISCDLEGSRCWPRIGCHGL